MPDSDYEIIHSQLADYPDNKLGFVIYCLTYEDNSEWASFMKYLNLRIRKGLLDDGEDGLIEHIDWSVQEDPQLAGALPSQVRK